MEKNFLFISNGSKQNRIQYGSIENYQIGSFERYSIISAKDLGYNIHMGINKKHANQIVCNEIPIKFYNAGIYRNIFNVVEIIIAILRLIKYIKLNDIDVLHCNTPIGGLVGRISGKITGVKKIIYTVHGFHFYSGGNGLKNFIYKSIEKFLARFTDLIIVINQEDFNAANKFKLRANGKVKYIPGVGIDTRKFEVSMQINNNLRNDIGITNNDIVLISVGDLNKNKNNLIVLKALNQLRDEKIHYLICGEGNKKSKLSKYAKKNNLSNNVHLLGKRNDIPSLLSISNIFILPSFREGLSRSLMEAMSSGLPCIVSKIRGNEDLIAFGGGIMIEKNNISLYADAIKTLASNKEMREIFGQINKKNIANYDFVNVKTKSHEIFKEFI